MAQDALEPIAVDQRSSAFIGGSNVPIGGSTQHRSRDGVGEEGEEAAAAGVGAVGEEDAAELRFGVEPDDGAGGAAVAEGAGAEEIALMVRIRADVQAP